MKNQFYNSLEASSIPSFPGSGSIYRLAIPTEVFLETLHFLLDHASNIKALEDSLTCCESGQLPLSLLRKMVIFFASNHPYPIYSLLHCVYSIQSQKQVHIKTLNYACKELRQKRGIEVVRLFEIFNHSDSSLQELFLHIFDITYQLILRLGYTNTHYTSIVSKPIEAMLTELPLLEGQYNLYSSDRNNIYRLNLSKALSYIAAKQYDQLLPLVKRRSFASLRLQKKDFSQLHIESFYFSRAELIDCHFDHSIIRLCDFSKSLLLSTSFKGAEIDGKSLTTLVNAIRYANRIERKNKLPLTTLDHTTIVGDLTGIDLSFISMQGANLTHANLLHANLTKANISDTIISSKQLAMTASLYNIIGNQSKIQQAIQSKQQQQLHLLAKATTPARRYTKEWLKQLQKITFGPDASPISSEILTYISQAPDSFQKQMYHCYTQSKQEKYALKMQDALSDFSCNLMQSTIEHQLSEHIALTLFQSERHDVRHDDYTRIKDHLSHTLSTFISKNPTISYQDFLPVIGLLAGNLEVTQKGEIEGTTGLASIYYHHAKKSTLPMKTSELTFPKSHVTKALTDDVMQFLKQFSDRYPLSFNQYVLDRILYTLGNELFGKGHSKEQDQRLRNVMQDIIDRLLTRDPNIKICHFFRNEFSLAKMLSHAFTQHSEFQANGLFSEDIILEEALLNDQLQEVISKIITTEYYQLSSLKHEEFSTLSLNEQHAVYQLSDFLYHKVVSQEKMIFPQNLDTIIGQHLYYASMHFKYHHPSHSLLSFTSNNEVLSALQQLYRSHYYRNEQEFSPYIIQEITTLFAQHQVTESPATIAKDDAIRVLSFTSSNPTPKKIKQNTGISPFFRQLSRKKYPILSSAN